ncbi:MAG: hypothetical protein JJ892_14080 [Balneola sp.]|nr:hypothetical protein [Balneola sp.]MBO6649885.1 hypothetical protein [Balneola sp.]MBO6712449.1 hypothetical protein [Balneola sp.]MBO6801400.1 hypothetical protein [Balneola sp.]MBO6871786.1 hypothetical protein [Balneola sp.]
MIFTLIGAVLLLVPTKTLFYFNKYGYYFIFKNKINTPEDEERVLKKMKVIYKSMGSIFLIIGISDLIREFST